MQAIKVIHSRVRITAPITAGAAGGNVSIQLVAQQKSKQVVTDSVEVMVPVERADTLDSMAFYGTTDSANAEWKQPLKFPAGIASDVGGADVTTYASASGTMARSGAPGVTNAPTRAERRPTLPSTGA